MGLVEDQSRLNNLIKDFNKTYKQYKVAVENYGDTSPQVEDLLTILQFKQSKIDSYKKLNEDTSVDYRNPNKGNRLKAENALYHTIGPLTDSPKWANEWTSSGSPPEGFVPGGAAPRWTPEQIIFAMAGDPTMLFSGQNSHPLSPHNGRGAPLFRMAKRLARIYNRPNDRQLIQDLYQNGFIPLLRMMQPGYDEGKSGFISYVMRNIESAMGHGTGGTSQSKAAVGYTSKEGFIGYKGLLDVNNPKKVRKIAEQIGVNFRNEPSNVKDSKNPFGKYSSDFYKHAIEYAEALESEDDNKINDIVQKINKQIDLIEDEDVMLLGASTGVGQAISTPDRKTSIGISSINAPADGNDRQQDQISGSDEGQNKIENDETMEVISLMLERAMNFDFGTLGPKYKQMAADFGAKGAVKFAGPLNITQLRYTIRTLGNSGQNYPGKGVIRKNTNIPREAANWCQPGEDPEIEPIPNTDGAIWKSAWVRNNYPTMGPTPITKEMTDEVREFEKLNIATARKVKTKAKGKEEAVSKVAVGNAITAAKIKLKVLAAIERDILGIDESKITGPLLEDIKYKDQIDRELIAEACDYVCDKLDEALKNQTFLVLEKEPVFDSDDSDDTLNQMLPISFIDME